MSKQLQLFTAACLLIGLLGCQGRKSNTPEDLAEIQAVFAAEDAGDLDSALSQLDEGLQGLVSLDVERHRQLQRNVVSNGTDVQMARVRAAYSHYVESHPDLPEAHYLHGVLCNAAERLEAFKKSTELEPDFVAGRRAYGLALVADGRFREAIAHLDFVVHQDPSHFSLMRSIAACHFELGEYEKALTWLETSYSRFKADASLQDTEEFDRLVRELARMHGMLGQHDKAALLFEEMLTDSEVTLELLGDAIRNAYQVSDYDRAAELTGLWMSSSRMEHVLVVDRIVCPKGIYEAFVVRDSASKDVVLVCGARMDPETPPKLEEVRALYAADGATRHEITYGNIDIEVADSERLPEMIMVLLQEQRGELGPSLDEFPPYSEVRELWLVGFGLPFSSPSIR